MRGIGGGGGGGGGEGGLEGWYGLRVLWIGGKAANCDAGVVTVTVTVAVTRQSNDFFLHPYDTYSLFKIDDDDDDDDDDDYD